MKNTDWWCLSKCAIKELFDGWKIIGNMIMAKRISFSFIHHLTLFTCIIGIEQNAIILNALESMEGQKKVTWFLDSPLIKVLCLKASYWLTILEVKGLYKKLKGMFLNSRMVFGEILSLMLTKTDLNLNFTDWLLK